jgi:hypothetical protein
MLLIEYSYGLKPDSTLLNTTPTSIPIKAPKTLDSNINYNLSYINYSTWCYCKLITLYTNNIPGLPNNILNIVFSLRLYLVTIALY